MACARAQVSPEPSSHLRQLARPDLDWGYFLHLARRHKIAPVVYRRLEEGCLELVPGPVAEELRQFYEANLASTLQLTFELSRLLDLLAAARLPVLVFKGPALSRQAYQNLSLRQFVDLDLLVPQSEVIRAGQLLQQNGYTPRFDLSEAQQTAYARSFYEHTYRQENSPLTVDLHWAVLPRHFSFSPDPELVWARRVPLRLDFSELQTLAPEDTLLFLGAHCAKDNWSSLGGLCDIAGLIQHHPGLDWDWLHRQAGRFGSRRMFFVGLYLAHHKLATPLPPAVLARLAAQPELSALAEKIWQGLFQDKPGMFSWYVTDNFYLQSMERRRDRLQYWLDEVVTPTPYEWALVKLPPRLAWLYYPRGLAWPGRPGYYRHRAGPGRRLAEPRDTFRPGLAEFAGACSGAGLDQSYPSIIRKLSGARVLCRRVQQPDRRPKAALPLPVEAGIARLFEPVVQLAA